ncbi:MAG: IS30 family transposase [Bacteroidia bacterium]
MTQKYKHLQPEQRYQIEGFLQLGIGVPQIANSLGVCKCTIYREIKRNTPQRGQGALVYKALNAQEKTHNRHRQKKKHIRFTEEMKSYCRTLLEQERYSPELIAVMGLNQFDDFVSHETIYKWIWSGKHSHRRERKRDKLLYKFLKHSGRRRKRGNIKDNRGFILHRTSIEDRPQIINDRKRIGDVEADLVLGKNHQPGLLVVTDRKLRMNWIEKITSKESNYIEKKLRKIIRRSTIKIKSITFDNDQAFAKHYKLRSDFGVKTYFTHPYTSQEKGTVENRIGVIRRFFPKRTDFKTVENKQVRKVEKSLNNRPLRLFNYASPNEQYEKMVLLRC